MERDSNDLNDTFIAALLAYDEALAKGATPTPANSDSLSPEVRALLGRSQALLRRLEAERHAGSPSAGISSHQSEELGDFRLLREIGRGPYASRFLEAELDDQQRGVLALRVLAEQRTHATEDWLRMLSGIRRTDAGFVMLAAGLVRATPGFDLSSLAPAGAASAAGMLGLASSRKKPSSSLSGR